MRRDVSLALSLSLSLPLVLLCVCAHLSGVRLDALGSRLVWSLPSSPSFRAPCALAMSCWVPGLLVCLLAVLNEIGTGARKLPGPEWHPQKRATVSGNNETLSLSLFLFSSCPRAECYTTTSNKRRLQPASSRRQSASRRTTVLGCAAQPF